MTATIGATFDGSVFRPIDPIALAPNTQVRLTVETLPPASTTSHSFLQTAQALNLAGPPDWSSNVDKYLYGPETERAS